jgi:hypothetical protein
MDTNKDRQKYAQYGLGEFGVNSKGGFPWLELLLLLGGVVVMCLIAAPGG